MPILISPAAKIALPFIACEVLRTEYIVHGLQWILGSKGRALITFQQVGLHIVWKTDSLVLIEEYAQPGRPGLCSTKDIKLHNASLIDSAPFAMLRCNWPSGS